MVITSSGPRCDVCGNYILPLGDTMMQAFTIGGLEQMLHVGSGLLHETCTPALKAAMASKDWQALPAGPLRKAYEEAAAAGRIEAESPSPDVPDEPAEGDE